MRELVVVLVAADFLLGLLSLATLELLTKRISSRLSGASRDAQAAFINTGNYLGSRTMKIAVGLALWVFWPAAVYGALENWASNRSRQRGKL